MKIVPFVVFPVFLSIGAALTACGASPEEAAPASKDSQLGAESSSTWVPTCPSSSPWPAPSGSASAPVPSASGSHPWPVPSGSGYWPPAPPPPFTWAAACPATATAGEPRPAPTGPVEDLRDYLEGTRSGLVGHWRGTTTTPWDGPYSVYIAFEADGHYATRSSSASPALSYGTDLDTPLKRWALDDISVYGAASGSIDIVFDYGDGQFGLAGWTGELDEVTIDAAGNRAHLELTTSNGNGPVQLDLWRCE